MHLSVLIAHDFSEYIFIKIDNFLLGEEWEQPGEPSSFPSLPTRPGSCLGLSPPGEGEGSGGLCNSAEEPTGQPLQARPVASSQVCNAEVHIHLT